MLQSLFYLITALHVSGINITHFQEHKTTVTTASGNRYTVLLSAAIVEELELLLTQSDYTRCCINTTVLLRMSTELIKTCRGFK
jgi:hypothetical protein